MEAYYSTELSIFIHYWRELDEIVFSRFFELLLRVATKWSLTLSHDRKRSEKQRDGAPSIAKKWKTARTRRGRFEVEHGSELGAKMSGPDPPIRPLAGSSAIDGGSGADGVYTSSATYGPWPAFFSATGQDGERERKRARPLTNVLFSERPFLLWRAYYSRPV